MEVLVLFSPLVGALFCGFGWRFLGENLACWVATALLFLSAVLSWILFLKFDRFEGVDEELRLWTLDKTSEMRGSSEGQEGLSSFLDRRKPSWYPDEN